MDPGEKRQVAERKERLPGELCSIFILYVMVYENVDIEVNTIPTVQIWEDSWRS